jgi:hypothetical protein
MRFDYSKWQGPRPEDVRFIKQLMDIYRNLMLQTGGDAAGAALDGALRRAVRFNDTFGTDFKTA